ncbi:MAG: hypothetical protein ACLFR6_04790 [Salinarchaeum sp.]
MRPIRLGAIAVAALLLVGGIAAVGAASPPAQAQHNGPDHAGPPEEIDADDDEPGAHDGAPDEEDEQERDDETEREHEADADDDTSDDREEELNDTDDADTAESAPPSAARGPDERAGPPADVANRADNASTQVGPPDGLPEQAPDRVSDIHDTIEAFLNGSIDNLGPALGDAFENKTDADSDDAMNESDTDSDGMMNEPDDDAVTNETTNTNTTDDAVTNETAD